VIKFPVTLGSINGTPLVVNAGYSMSPTSDLAVPVVLTKAYAMATPPNFPTRPQWVGTQHYQQAQTLAIGATFTTFQAEADALVAAGAATYADPAYVPPVFPNYPIAT
jgi:hypothetical protein